VNKVFLSHSSSDKSAYVDVVARRLGEQNIEYDAATFEEGERSEDEINKRIGHCALFALFISSAALDSKWVQSEIAKAEKSRSAGGLRKFWPVIIDKSITYKDPRIPEWIRREYNLKLVSRPAVAARRIEAKLRQLHWDGSPKSSERRRIFVGRNELVASIENRFDDVDLPKPSCVIASGLPRIGRSNLLRHGLVKVSLIDAAYEPLKITLEREESIEDLILKIFDTGLTSLNGSEVSGLLSKTVPEKIEILSGMLIDIRRAREILFIEDRGCVVNYAREIAFWFADAIAAVGVGARPVACVAATYRTDPAYVRRNAYFYALEIPELSPRERSGLFKRILELHEFDISIEDFSFFAEQLKGFPEEAIFGADLVLDLGVEGAKAQAHQITEFNTERASLLLRQFEAESEVLDFIYLLSEFEFVGVSFLFEIVDEAVYQPLLDVLVTNLICDFIGAEKEFVRLNDTIRDLIRRNRFALASGFAAKLKAHVRDFVNDSEKFERDSADFFYSIKSALAQGIEIDPRYLAPSHILRTMKDLYYARRREQEKRLIHLADMLLEKEAFLDPKVTDDVRYYLCLCLARQRDRRVLAEVMKVGGPEHNFILGFYYRNCGRHKEAIEKLTSVLDKPYIASRAKRELVQVYLYIEEFETAMAMARENYLASRGNQYPIQSYMNCMLNSDEAEQHRDEILGLIGELRAIGSVQAEEMAMIGQAVFEAKLNGNKEAAYDLIEQASSVQGSHFPLLAKFDIALRFHDRDELERSLNALKEMSKTRNFSENTLVKNEAYFLAATGEVERAKKVLLAGLKNYPEFSIQKYLGRLDQVSEKFR